MPNRDFEYLLNAMEGASHHTNPAEHAYKGKREAVFAHVAQLSADLAEAVAALQEHCDASTAFVGDTENRAALDRLVKADEAAEVVLAKHK